MRKVQSSKSIENRFEIMRILVAVVIALAITLLLIVIVSDSPGEALSQFLLGPISSTRNFGNVLELFIPLTFAGLAMAVMFQCNQFNMAAEGAFLIGGLGAGYIAAEFVLPAGIHPAIAILVGGALGAIACTIPAIFKVKWGANEVVSSLMLNYVILYFTSYILNYILLDPTAGFPASDTFAKSAVLTDIIKSPNVHAGIVLAIIAVVVTYLFLYKTKWGYAIRITGKNEDFAKYSGISVGSTIILAQVVGGALAGREKKAIVGGFLWLAFNVP